MTSQQFSDATKIVVVGTGGPETIDVSGSSYTRGLEINAFAGNDLIYGTQYGDTIYGGNGADTLYGDGLDLETGNVNASATDTFAFLAGQSQTTANNYDHLIGFTLGGSAYQDILDLVGSPSIVADATHVQYGSSNIYYDVSGGVVGNLKDGAGNSVTLASVSEWVALVDVAVGSGQSGGFVYGNNTYIFQDNDGGTNNLLISLDGVQASGITAGSGVANTVKIA